jgi:predicted Zn-dependent peptidase
MKESVDSITSRELYDYYQNVISEDQMDLYVIGDVDIEQVENFCDRLFSLPERETVEVDSSEVKRKEKENVVKENQDVKQGKLNMGYRTNTHFGDKDYFALQVFNGIFGGFSHSKLFINVREKASLAYYAASRLESHKGLMMVMSGIEFKNYDQAVGIINEQLEAMRNGDFTDGEVEQTKAVIKNQLLETVDTSRGLIEVLYHNAVSNKQIDLKTWLSEVESTTKEEIIAAANKVELDTIYFLTGMEE